MTERVPTNASYPVAAAMTALVRAIGNGEEIHPEALRNALAEHSDIPEDLLDVAVEEMFDVARPMFQLAQVMSKVFEGNPLPKQFETVGDMLAYVIAPVEDSRWTDDGKAIGEAVMRDEDGNVMFDASKG